MKNETKVLVATDVLMRTAFGSTNIVMVINFNPPIGPNLSFNKKHYKLRAGRAGQFGRGALVVDFTKVNFNHGSMQINF